MKQKMKWYQVLRIVLPVVYGLLLALGYIYKSFLVMGVLMISALAAGAFYCGWFCPFGALQEGLGRAGRLLKIPRIRISDKIERVLKYSRFVLLGLSMTTLLFVYFLSGPYNTFQGVLTGHTGLISASAWVLLALFLVLSLFVDRPFCRYFCTEGARYGLVSLLRVFGIRRRDVSCISCGRCDRACPVQIRVSTKGHVRSARCINCFECIAACPVKETLSFGWVLNKKDLKMKITTKKNRKEFMNEQAS